MTVIVLVNVGSRDVMQNNAVLKPTRDEGKRVFDTYDEVQDTLSFPILQPPLEQILSETPRIDRLIFFGTDQDNSKFQATDTIYFARTARRFVLAQYGARIGEVTAVPIHGINPALYDEALAFFRDELPRLHLSPKEATAAYLLPTAGTPACSMALLLEGMTLFGDRSQVIYQNAHNKQHGRLPMVSQIQMVFRKQTAVHLLQQFNFYAAEQILKEAGLVNPLVDNLLHYAIARLGFEFGAAERYLKQAIAQARGAVRDTLIEVRADLTALTSQQPPALLGELFHNARIAWENGRSLDFLARLIPFQQTALALAVEMMPPDTFPQPVQKESLANEDMRQWILALMVTAVQHEMESMFVLSPPKRQELSQKMQAYYNLDELRGVCFDLGIDFENLAGETKQRQVVSLIQYCERHGLLHALLQKNKEIRSHAAWHSLDIKEPADNLPRLILALNRLEKLRPLYQESILAAGFGGITEQAIVDQYTTAKSETEDHQARVSPLHDMADICTAMNLSTENPFRQVRDILIEKLG